MTCGSKERSAWQGWWTFLNDRSWQVTDQKRDWAQYWPVVILNQPGHEIESKAGLPFLADSNIAHDLPFGADSNLAHDLPFWADSNLAHDLPFWADPNLAHDLLFWADPNLAHDLSWPRSLRMAPGQYCTQPCFWFYDLMWPPTWIFFKKGPWSGCSSSSTVL